MQTPTHLLDKTAAVYRRQETLDDGGCPISSYTLVSALAKVKCRIQPGDDLENIENDVERSLCTHIMYAEPADIRPSDLIRVAAPTEADYNVISVYDPDDQHVFLRVLLEIVV